MVQFWRRIYSIYKKNITRRISLNISGLKDIITVADKDCNDKKLCKIKVKQLFRSYTNKIFLKIKNFNSYNIWIYVAGSKVMEKKINRNAIKFSFSFLYPQANELDILIKTRINGRIFKQKIKLR